MSIAENFEDKITAGKLSAPIPRWEIILKRAFIWTALSLFVVLGAVSAGVLAWFLFDPSDLAGETGKFNLIGKFLEDLPLFWTIISLASAVIAVWIFTKSPRGYRFRVAAVSVACLVAFLALGAAMAFGGISDKIESMASSYLPVYRKMAQPLVQKLMKPQEGAVIGKVDKIGDSFLELTDPSGSVWQIKLNSGIRLPKQVESGACLRVFGETSTNSREMVAEVISSCPRGVRLKMSKPSDEIRTSTMRIINYAPSMVWLRSNS
ncbi:MAG: hypothetical protein PHC70_00060 [Patescibacteria group bacterium]|nr:hypothetical protein [Patescibacteria group bacterium]